MTIAVESQLRSSPEKKVSRASTENCRANAEATGSNPVEPPKTKFFFCSEFESGSMEVTKNNCFPST